MLPLPPRSTRTEPRLPYTPLFRSRVHPRETAPAAENAVLILLALDSGANQILDGEAGLVDHSFQFGIGIRVAFGSDMERRHDAIARESVYDGKCHKIGRAHV